MPVTKRSESIHMPDKRRYRTCGSKGKHLSGNATNQELPSSGQSNEHFELRPSLNGN
jgi:hypothetical protein